MGAWGVGIWENDEALDIIEDFKENTIKFESKQKAFDYISKDNRHEYDDDALLALAGIQVKYSTLLNRKILKEAINFCDEKSDVKYYQNPDKRAEVLDKFKEEIGKFLEKVSQID